MGKSCFGQHDLIHFATPPQLRGSFFRNSPESSGVAGTLHSAPLFRSHSSLVVEVLKCSLMHATSVPRGLEHLAYAQPEATLHLVHRLSLEDSSPDRGSEVLSETTQYFRSLVQSRESAFYECST